LERIRSLEPGRALVLHRRTPPVEAVLDPWWRQPCAKRVTAALAEADRRCRLEVPPANDDATSDNDETRSTP